MARGKVVVARRRGNVTPPALPSATYVLPLRRWSAAPPAELDELTAYLRRIRDLVEVVVVVDGSEPEVFRRHHDAWGSLVDHRPVDDDVRSPMGKVGGVITGIRAATTDIVVVADDDVRYDRASLTAVIDRMRT